MNPYKKAFQEPANLIGIAAVVATSAAMLQPDIAAIGAVIETAYLLFLPETKWYKNRLLGGMSLDRTALTESEIRAERVRSLPLDLQTRYQRLVTLRSDIETKFKAQVSFPTEVVVKLDQLLGQFVDLAVTHTQFVTYLQSLVSSASPQSGIPSTSGGRQQAFPTSRVYGGMQSSGYQQSPGMDFNQLTQEATAKTEKWVQWAVGRAQSEYNAEINRLDPDSESDPSLKEIKIKRVDIISRRNEYLGKLGKAILSSLMQLQLIEDTVGLIDDQVSTQSQEQVVSEIDSLMQQTDVLTKSLAEVGQMYATQSA